MTDRITVVGGGIAGLTAAIACAEAGVPVALHEAHRSLGGRGRATQPPYVAHEGAHVFYADGPHWPWLQQRGFVAELGRPRVRDARFGFLHEGRLRRLPPSGMVRMALPGRPRSAPVDETFHSWATRRWGPQAARAAANAVAVTTFDADTGRLSAAFVWELYRRVFAPRPPAVRWVVGGWQAVLHRMEVRARQLGVEVHLGSRVERLPESGPVIVATELAAARRLLEDPTLHWESGHCVLLDLAVRRRTGDRFLVFDLDDGGFHESYSLQDPTTAPAGESLFQLDMPVRPDETSADAHARLATLADRALPGRRERTVWQRSGTARGRSGALDPPGHTWRDRPAIRRGEGVFLAGDMVAAPGMRGEISLLSGLRAAEGAVQELRRSTASRT